MFLTMRERDNTPGICTEPTMVSMVHMMTLLEGGEVNIRHPS